MNELKKDDKTEWAVTMPSLGWLLVFFVVPTFLIFTIAFKPATPFGGIGEGWTLQTLRNLGDPNYPAIVWRTIWLSALTTVLCILLALPAGYYIARLSDSWRRFLLLLVIIPFWTSFLIRIFAWKVLLHPEGYLKKTLAFFHIVQPDAILLYNPWAVLLVLVYTYLPFAILPIYAAAEKFDYRIVEAARDLGAGGLRAFFSVFLPGVSRGVFTAVLVVFIPTLGSYVIPDIVGGPGGEMIGNKIAQRVFVDRNLPNAAALSAVLVLAVIIPLIIVLFMRKSEGKAKPFLTEDA